MLQFNSFTCPISVILCIYIRLCSLYSVNLNCNIMYHYYYYSRITYFIIVLMVTGNFCWVFAAREPSTITLPNQGTIIAHELSRSRVQKILAYYGIPYAQPPVDSLRFAPPVTDPLPSWDGIRNTTDYMPACLQSASNYKAASLPFMNILPDKKFDMQEDCLYLNVFVPFGSVPQNGFATVVWIHPGNFTTGAPFMWNPHTLVYRHRIILVTVAWRLNVLGFFTTMDGEASGNYGLLDQQAALIWLQSNVKLFGGNPSNICLMGYGAGAVSVGLHMINSNSRDLFHKAILMSGDLFSSNTVKSPERDRKLLDRLAEGFGCIRRPTNRLLDCLRQVDAELLVQETSEVDWKPIIDAGLSNSTPPFLAEPPKNYFERGDFSRIPLLTGYTNMEDVLSFELLNDDNLPPNVTNEYFQQVITGIVTGDIKFPNNTESCVYNYEHMLDSVMFFYTPTSPIKDAQMFRTAVAAFLTERSYAASTFLLATYVGADQPTFVYRFDVRPITQWVVENLPDWVTVPHLFDLMYSWGVPYWPETSGSTWELRDKRISDTIMSFWTNFIKTTNPTGDTVYPINWDRFTEQSPGILIVDGSFNMSNDMNLNYKAFEFWNDFFPKVMHISQQCCGITDSSVNIIHLDFTYWIVLSVLVKIIM